MKKLTNHFTPASKTSRIRYCEINIVTLLREWFVHSIRFLARTTRSRYTWVKYTVRSTQRSLGSTRAPDLLSLRAGWSSWCVHDEYTSYVYALWLRQRETNRWMNVYVRWLFSYGLYVTVVAINSTSVIPGWHARHKREKRGENLDCMHICMATLLFSMALWRYWIASVCLLA